jgi:hypothetical protein
LRSSKKSSGAATPAPPATMTTCEYLGQFADRTRVLSENLPLTAVVVGAQRVWDHEHPVVLFAVHLGERVGDVVWHIAGIRVGAVQQRDSALLVHLIECQRQRSPLLTSVRTDAPAL